MCTAITSTSVSAEPTASDQAGHLPTVRAYADTMLENGRDRCGEPSPLFVSMLNRQTRDLFDEGDVALMDAPGGHTDFSAGGYDTSLELIRDNIRGKP